MVRDQGHRMDTTQELAEKCNREMTHMKQITETNKMMVNQHEEKLQKLGDSFNIYDHRLNRLEIDMNKYGKDIEAHTTHLGKTDKSLENIDRKIYSL